MKKTLFVFVFFILLSPCSFGQTNSDYFYKDIKILDSDTLMPGFYLTYNDFIKNKPSEMGLNFNSDIHFYHKEAHLSGKKQKLYVFYGNNKKKTKIKFKFWGYNNGKSIYIYYKKRFCKLNIMGRYSVILWQIDKNYYSSHSFTSVNYKAYNEYILDLLTGDSYKLNSRNIRKYVLKDEPELIKEFNNETLRETMYYMYLKKINSSYR